MGFTTQDYLKKTLLDTQERVRDFMHFSDNMEDAELKKFFKEYANNEAEHAERLRNLIK